MTIRESLERYEKEYLSPYAALSKNSRGRLRPEEQCDIRPVFQRDRDRIIHSKSFRRLKDKTQVFLTPEGDHYRTRLTHTLEVSQNARTIAKALRLNEDLAEAIAMGHDLGHTPFGHAGERALAQMMGDEGFHHNEQSLRVVDLLEKGGEGLNLTYEVRMGILGHTGSRIPETLEGQIIRLADRIAYVNHDIDDAVRAGILRNEDIPKSISKVLGDSHSMRLNTLVCDMIENSWDSNEIVMSQPVERALWDLRGFLFERVYRNPVAKGQEGKAQDMLQWLFRFYEENPDRLPVDFQPQISMDGMRRTICDYIAGMTDRFAVTKYEELFVPKSWSR